jgi:hypothetical protein
MQAGSVRARIGIGLAVLAGVATFGSASGGCGPPRGDPPSPRERSDSPTDTNAAACSALAARLPDAGVVERFVAATALLVGIPYHDGPLGEGEAGRIDSDPRVDFERADCVTYLEESLALALVPSGSAAEFLAALDAIRYRDGRVEFTARNHYMVADWIPANSRLVEDVTAEVLPGKTVSVSRVIDRAAFLRDHGAEPSPERDRARTIEIRIVPRELVAHAAPRIRSGDLIFWVGKREGIFVVHTGLAVRSEEGGLLFRHASSKAGLAVDEPLTEYAERSAFAAGFLVLRLRPPSTDSGVAGARRTPGAEGE